MSLISCLRRVLASAHARITPFNVNSRQRLRTRQDQGKGHEQIRFLTEAESLAELAPAKGQEKYTLSALESLQITPEYTVFLIIFGTAKVETSGGWDRRRGCIRRRCMPVLQRSFLF